MPGVLLKLSSYIFLEVGWGWRCLIGSQPHPLVVVQQNQRPARAGLFDERSEALGPGNSRTLSTGSPNRKMIIQPWTFGRVRLFPGVHVRSRLDLVMTWWLTVDLTMAASNLGHPTFVHANLTCHANLPCCCPKIELSLR